MTRRESKKLINGLENTSKEAREESSSDESIDSEEEQKKIEEQTEKVNKELEDMDEAAKKRIKNLECEAHRYLWFPDLENGNEVRCRCCFNKHFKSMEAALEHLSTKQHKHKARRYVIDNCKDKELIERKKKEAKERMLKWIERKRERKAAAKKEKLKNLSEEEIARRKAKFQEKKARRLARKKAQESKEE
ncbi:hypothetical protein AV274_1777 [Blastocystis sp. ATCC 50177/Nand II]|uniref:Uncharacterized protein n=1 Tax=Blastocystis sp. subtype 1 (strain ATCC 50177 / NandII) TaxID=478820 RepID=A0A196SKP8_BLAHN|nr:hypothetical protein AV274_1777 [Blastocystis sp. ATCC 50177/Nand II]